LFETTGWNASYQAAEGELFSAISNSWHALSVYAEGGELVGFGRIVSDGVLYAFVCDMIVAPDYQLRGVGSMIMEALLERCREAGIRVVWLFSASGKAGFYEKHGFEKRPSNAPGMQMELNIRV
jgi:GNAT superfamily N-acetyltransferase